MSHPRLHLVELEPRAGSMLELAEGQVFGRDADCEIRLGDPLVSRRHAVVWVSAGAVGVEDLESRNGVFVDGERRTGIIRLAPGNVLRIGTVQWLVTPAPE